MKFQKLAVCGAILGLSQASVIQAQEAKACMEPIHAEALVTYLLPSAVEAARAKCAGNLPVDASLLMENSEQLAKYKAAADAAWPDARIAISSISGDKFPDDVDDSLIKPLAGLFLVSMIEKEIRPKDCALINNIYTDLQPMPSSNIASLAITIVSAATKNDKDTKLPICRPLED